MKDVEVAGAARLEEIRRIYRAERDKRLRADTDGQFRKPEGELAAYEADPFAGPASHAPRDPIDGATDAIVVEAGLAGLYAAVRLKECGYERVRLVDTASDVGGVWYWNRYPGAQCDIESHIYLPLLAEMQYRPSERYVHQPEIWAHMKNIARRYDLYRDACFGTRATELRWDEAARTWHVSTDSSDRLRAKVVVLSLGPLNRPRLPGIPGIERFAGESFHTSRWNYAYTGGTHEGGMDRLADKRVGIIGTGATAIQCIPHLAASARQLHVFQRTPSAIWERNNHPTPPDWADLSSPAAQAQRMMDFDLVVDGLASIDSVPPDSWTKLCGALAGLDPAEAEVKDLAIMEAVRARVDRIVKDPSTAAALKPYFRALCKRPGFHDEYLESFNRPNVQLVPTGGFGVEKIEGKAVRVQGRAYELDCLVLATGFEASTSYVDQLRAEIIGAGGVRISRKWASGFRTFFGLQSHGFPNCFFLGYTQTGQGNNYTHGIHRAVEHMAFILKAARAAGATRIDVSPESENWWSGEMEALAGRKSAFWRECIPSRLNNQGNVDSVLGRAVGRFGGSPVRFWAMLKAWRDKGDLDGLVLG